MKRKKFLKYLSKNNCELLREGSRHSWWINKNLDRRSSISRHNEINDLLVKKICKDLGVPDIKKQSN